MKPIIISEKNISRIDKAIKMVEGRAKERLMDASDLLWAIKNIENTLKIPKCHMEGVKVDIDVNAQKFPNSYKWEAYSTQATILFSRGSWKVVNVERAECRRSKRYIIHHTDASRTAIIERLSYID